MPKFYVTYGFGSNLAKCYSVVEGDDYRSARNYVADAIGSKFAFMYDEDEFAGQVEKYGLREVPLQPQFMED